MNKYQELLSTYIGETKMYKEWCQILNEEPKRGKAKNTHLKQWNQYMDIVSNNRKLTLVSVYNDENLQLIEKHGKFTTYIENFLTLYFEKCDSKYVILSNKDILEKAYMVNSNYFKGKRNPYDYVKNFQLPLKEEDIPDEEYALRKTLDESSIFFSASYRLLKRIIYDSLVSMENRLLIQKNKTFRLYKNYIDKNGIARSTHHDCNDDEIQRILSVQYKTLAQFNKSAPSYDNGDKKYYIDDIRNIHILHKREKDEFYNMLNNNIQEEFKQEGYNAYSVAWKINLADKSCFQREINKMNFAKLNENVQDKLLNAKDLSVIETVLKQQLIDKFIKL